MTHSATAKHRPVKYELRPQPDATRYVCQTSGHVSAVARSSPANGSATACATPARISRRTGDSITHQPDPRRAPNMTSNAIEFPQSRNSPHE